MAVSANALIAKRKLRFMIHPPGTRFPHFDITVCYANCHLILPLCTGDLLFLLQNCHPLG